MTTSTEQTQRPRPSGWKGHRGDKYRTKDSKHGCRCMCQTCSKNNLGLSDAARMHWKDCAHYPVTKTEPTPEERREALRKSGLAKLTLEEIEALGLSPSSLPSSRP